jgi:CDP-paratose 2-epimerase
MHYNYLEQNRIGDHICYISDLRKFRSHYPDWTITRSLESILDEMILAEESRAAE